MIEVTADITGLAALSKSIAMIGESVDPQGKAVKDVSVSAARIVRNEIKRRAPKGPTGNLKRGIVAKKFTTRGPAAAFVAVDYKIAPHAHLVEYGTARRSVKKKKVMKGKDGKFYGREVGPMPAKPFFRSGADASERQAVDWMAKMVERNIKILWD